MNASTGASALPTRSRRLLISGLLLAGTGAIAASGKAVIVKLAYRHGADATTLLALRMLIAFPFFIAMGLWAARPCPGATGDGWCCWASAAITCPATWTSLACSTSARRWNG